MWIIDKWNYLLFTLHQRNQVKTEWKCLNPAGDRNGQTSKKETCALPKTNGILFIKHKNVIKLKLADESVPSTLPDPQKIELQ